MHSLVMGLFTPTEPKMCYSFSMEAKKMKKFNAFALQMHNYSHFVKCVRSALVF